MTATFHRLSLYTFLQELQVFHSTDVIGLYRSFKINHRVPTFKHGLSFFVSQRFTYGRKIIILLNGYMMRTVCEFVCACHSRFVHRPWLAVYRERVSKCVSLLRQVEPLLDLS